MFSLISRRSIRLLLNGEQGIQFSGYKIGSFSEGIISDLRNTEISYGKYFDEFLTDVNNVWDNFTVKYESNETAISYIPLTSNKLVLKCVTPPDTDTFFFNAVLIMAKFGDEEFIFSTQFYLVENPKFNLEISKGGMVHYFLETLKLEEYATKLDLSNLTIRVSTFDEYDTYLDLDKATHTREDQAVLNTHLTTYNDGPHILFDSEGQWFASPTKYIDFTNIESDYIVGGSTSIIEEYIDENGNVLIDELDQDLVGEI